MIEPNIWQDKVAGLPAFVQQQIADYIDFLVQKYQEPESFLSKAEQQQLEDRYADYLKSPASASDINDVKTRLTQKYGLSNKG